MSTQANLGLKALEAKSYEEAIKQYTEALKTSNSPIWLTQRSIAYHRAGNFKLALRDAEEAVLAAIARAKRELIATAQLRRAIALYSLKQYGDARMVFTWVRKLNEKEKGLGMWQAKLKMEFDKLPEDAEENKITVKETPDKPAPLDEISDSKAAEAKLPKSVKAEKAEKAVPVIQPTAAVIQTPKEKIREEWFQSSAKITITIFAKNVPKDQAEIEITENSVSCQLVSSKKFTDIA